MDIWDNLGYYSNEDLEPTGEFYTRGHNYNIAPPLEQVNDVLKRLGLKVQGE